MLKFGQLGPFKPSYKSIQIKLRHFLGLINSLLYAKHIFLFFFYVICRVRGFEDFLEGGFQKNFKFLLNFFMPTKVMFRALTHHHEDPTLAKFSAPQARKRFRHFLKTFDQKKLPFSARFLLKIIMNWHQRCL